MHRVRTSNSAAYTSSHAGGLQHLTLFRAAGTDVARFLQLRIRQRSKLRISSSFCDQADLAQPASSAVREAHQSIVLSLIEAQPTARPTSDASSSGGTPCAGASKLECVRSFTKKPAYSAQAASSLSHYPTSTSSPASHPRLSSHKLSSHFSMQCTTSYSAHRQLAPRAVPAIILSSPRPS